jgi:hypothetical protein
MVPQARSSIPDALTHDHYSCPLYCQHMKKIHSVNVFNKLTITFCIAFAILIIVNDNI